jgi:biotin carboxyl carrier protein
MKNYTITVNGNVYDVTVEEGTSQATAPRAAAPVAQAPVAAAPAPAAAPVAAAPAPAGSQGSVTVPAPMPGKILGV